MTTKWQGPEWVNATERDDKATESITSLRNQLEQDRIFFSVELCDKIKSILADSHQIKVEMIMAKKNAQINERHTKQGINVSVEDLLNPSSTWSELDEKVQKEIKDAKLKIAQEFRVLIGVT